MQIKTIKIAICGTGFAANLHAEAYEKVPGVFVDIVAVASVNRKEAEEFCDRYEIDKSRIYDDADKMIKEVDADIIDIIVPTFLHVDFAVKAAEAGKNVICEKPLTGYFGDLSIPIEDRKDVGKTDRKVMLDATVKDCERLQAAFDKSGTKFCYAENWCYAPPIAKAKKIIEKSKGKILEIRCGESHSGSHSKFAAEWKYTGGGALIRMGAHPYGAAIHLKIWEGMIRNGKPIYPKSVIATTARCRDILDELPKERDRIVSRPVDVEDWSTGIITFEDGTNATVIASDVTLGGIENWLNIYASNCRIEGKISNNNSVMAFAPTGEEFKDVYTIEKTETKTGWTQAQADEDWMTGYPFEVEDFIKSVLEDREPVSGIELAIWCAKTMYAAYLSAETGNRVDVPK